MTEETKISVAQSRITDEIFNALGLKRRGILRRLLGWFFTVPAGKFAKQMADADQAVWEGGMPAGSREMLKHLRVKVQVKGTLKIPNEGPSIILSNHPGAYDAIAIGSQVPRQDLKFTVSKTRFYQALPNIYTNLIPISHDTRERMVALRMVVDHLRKGGSLLHFGSGLIEPDPALHPIGENVLNKWSPSIEIFLRKAPETVVIPTIASGVLLKRFEKHPLTLIRNGGLNKRRLAEFLQVLHQLVRPEAIDAQAHISFGEPFTLADITSESEGRRILPAVISRIEDQLNVHTEWIGE